MKARTYRRILKLASELDRKTSATHSTQEWLILQRVQRVAALDETVAKSIETNLEVILHKADGHGTLSLYLDALKNFRGNQSYKKVVEEAFLSEMKFALQKVVRKEDDETKLEHKQNQLLKTALLRYIRRLCDIHSGQNIESTQSTEEIKLPEHIVVDINEEAQSQTIYVLSRESVTTSQEVSSFINLKNTNVHAETYSDATRISSAIMEETSIHRSRATTIVGHGYSGGIAVAIGLFLFAEGFTIRNVITFGGTKCIQTVLERYSSSINVIRVVIVGDENVDAPREESSGPFLQHVGELLQLSSAKNVCTIEGYHMSMLDDGLPTTHYDEDGDVI